MWSAHTRPAVARHNIRLLPAVNEIKPTSAGCCNQQSITFSQHSVAVFAVQPSRDLLPGNISKIALRHRLLFLSRNSGEVIRWIHGR